MATRSPLARSDRPDLIARHGVQSHEGPAWRLLLPSPLPTGHIFLVLSLPLGRSSCVARCTLIPCAHLVHYLPYKLV
jgi:hypothetical protein